MKDLMSNVKTEKYLTPADQAATITGSWVDMQGFERAFFEWLVGVDAALSGVNNWTFTIEHCPDDGAGAPDAGSKAFPTADLIQLPSGKTYTAATGVFELIDATTEDDVLLQIGYLGHPDFRYVRIVATEAGACTTPMGAVVQLTGSHLNPVSRMPAAIV